MNKKVALVAFNGDSTCFVHVLLNALDFHRKGYDVKVVLEGNATRLIRDLASPDHPLATLYARTTQEGLIDCVCKACAAKMDTLSIAEAQKLPVCSDMSGHPSLADYASRGYQIITF
ncbi:DsrE family protein [Desulfuromonas sp. AOP6]|uniref:DsrE family protein n=1 Tax=Desulfuromonas sp. AOP6 TaxID=1566351 RepID=UPI001285A066|nr:DsrE family protein [Desulfuromonas sp. AOP6]BCA80720.1 hypothetical protein AOP6_2507 [Desulfuromonas sp. AOP6]